MENGNSCEQITKSHPQTSGGDLGVCTTRNILYNYVGAKVGSKATGLRSLFN